MRLQGDMESTDDELDQSVFENKNGLADDMAFLASMPELCDVTFLVGDTREPVCAVKAVLAARSRWGVENCTITNIILSYYYNIISRN